MVHPPLKYVHEQGKERSKYRYPSKTLNPTSLKDFIYQKSITQVGELNKNTVQRYENSR